MSCIIKLRLESGFRVFDNEEQAKKFISDHNLDLDTYINEKGEKVPYLKSIKKNVSESEFIIREANKVSYEDTKDDLTKTNINGWDTEEYSKKSKAVSLSRLFSEITVQDPITNKTKRVFPEFITENYLNILTQSIIIDKYLSFKNENNKTDNDKVNLRHEIFDDITPDGWTGKKTSKEWYELAKGKLDNFNLIDSDLNEIDSEVIKINDDNFRMMLEGEFAHKIFELYLPAPKRSSNNYDAKVPSGKIDAKKNEIKSKILGDKGLFESFRTKYSDLENVSNPIEIIESLENNFDELFDDYFNSIVQAEQDIWSKIKKNNPSASLKWLTEKRITCDLKDPIEGKNKVRGKIDLILLVDDTPFVIDLKISRKRQSDWASEKTLKTAYQLAAYSKMLESIGINGITSHYVYNISIGLDGKKHGNLINFNGTINNIPGLQRNIDNIFDNVKNIGIINEDSAVNVEKITEEAFGVASTKAQRKLNKEFHKEQIKVVENKNGTYSISYNTLDDKGAPKKVTKTNITKENLELSIDSAANEIIIMNENKFHNRLISFKKDIERYIIGEIDIDDFSLAHNPQVKTRLYNLLLKYKGTKSKILKHPLADKYNLIIIQTPIGLDIIHCDTIDPRVPYDNLNKNGKLFDDIPGVTSDNVKNVGNVNIMISLLIANEIINHLSLNGQYKKINEVVAFDISKVIGYKMTTKDMSNNFSILANNTSQKIKNNISKNFVEPLANVLFSWNSLFSTLDGHTKVWKDIYWKFNDITNLSAIMEEEQKTMSEIKEIVGSESFSKNRKIEFLKELRSSIQQNYPQFFTGRRVVSEITILMDMVENALSIYEDRELNFENDISVYGFQTGSYFVSMDLIPNSNVRIINRIVTNGLERIHSRYNTYKAEARSKLQKLKDDQGFSKVEQITLGDTTRIYNNLFRTNSDGSLYKNDLVLKNPWTDDSLSSTEKDYIKYFLYTVNKYNHNKRWKSIKDMKETDLNESDYYIPLVRASGLYDKWKNQDGVNFDTIKSWFQEQRLKYIQMRDTLSSEDVIKERKSASDMLGNIRHEFHYRTNLDARKEQIENNGLSVFSRDLETILDYFVVAEESSYIFNTDTIPSIKGILYSTEMIGALSDNEMENLQKFVKEYMKSVVYGESLYHPDAQKYMSVIGPIKASASALALSWNMLNVPREMLMGLFNNISRSMFGTYGKETFTLKDYIKAFGIMHMDAPDFMHKITKIELLNEHFHMANMSITELPEQTTSNKTGINALFSRFAHWSITSADYWNRMTMFTAQMIHDGCFDAYEVDRSGGYSRLVYNMEKDERFKILCEYANKPNAIPHNLRKKFAYQKSLYKKMREDMISDSGGDIQIAELKDGVNTGKDWYLPKAYTNKQRNSLKSFADITFGYYDKETKAWFFKTALGGVFKQFMAYMTAKKSQYFFVRTDKTDRGSYEQVTDSKGNKIFKILITNDNGEIRPIEITENELHNNYKDQIETAEPVLCWTGAYMEGVFNSIVHLCTSLTKGSISAIKDGDTELLKEIYNQYIKKGDIRHSNLLQALWDALIAAGFMALLRMIFFKDPEMIGLSYEKQLMTKSAAFQNMYYIANQASQDFNIANTLVNGLFTWDIPALNIWMNASRNLWSTMNDDDLTMLEKFIVAPTKSFGIFKPFRPYAEALVRD